MDRQHPVYYTNPLYANGLYTAHKSVGGLFAPSLDAGMVVDSGAATEYIQGRIQACGSGEREWYRHGGIGFLSDPREYPGTYHVELINQVQRPDQQTTAHTFLEGQAFWRRTPVGIPYGYMYNYDPKPYIIIQQCRTTQYLVLLDHTGRLHPNLVSPHLVEPVMTTWVTARLPTGWSGSHDLQEVLNRRPA